MGLLKLSSIKNTASDDGEWIDIADWPGVKLLVRSIDSKDYVTARELLVQRLTKALGRMPTSPEMDTGLGKLAARHLLRGWEGIAGDDDKPEAFTPELALQYCSDTEMKAFRSQVFWAASRVGDKEVEFTVDAAKNSDAPSALT